MVIIWQMCLCVLKSCCFELSYSSCCNSQYADDLSKLAFVANSIKLDPVLSELTGSCSLLNGLYDFCKVYSEIVISMHLRHHLLCRMQLVILHVKVTELTGEEAGGMAVCILICFPRFVLLEMNQSQEKNVLRSKWLTLNYFLSLILLQQWQLQTALKRQWNPCQSHHWSNKTVFKTIYWPSKILSQIHFHNWIQSSSALSKLA